MTMSKNILVFFPHNFFELKSGCHKYIYELLRYFSARGFRVDFYSLENFENSWKGQDPYKEGLINELFLYDFSQGSGTKTKLTGHAVIRKILAALINNKPKPVHAISELFDFAFDSMKKQFSGILKKKKYDFIVLTYSFWARLLEDGSCKDSITVLEMQDFLTLNLFDAYEGNVKVGALLEEEIRRVNLFDKVVCISEEERLFFSRFAKKPEFHYVPLALPQKNTPGCDSCEYDLMFIGSGNPHNQAGIAWFFKEVYPRLKGNYKVAIIGEITKYLGPHQGVVLLEHVEDIDDVYPKARISICPLLGGTGLKIKVVEALSYGQPVVTTSYGVTGFRAKNNNGCCVADDPREFAYYIRKLIEDKGFYKQQRVLARAFFSENFEEVHVYKLLDRIYLN